MLNRAPARPNLAGVAVDHAVVRDEPRRAPFGQQRREVVLPLHELGVFVKGRDVEAPRDIVGVEVVHGLRAHRAVIGDGERVEVNILDAVHLPPSSRAQPLHPLGAPVGPAPQRTVPLGLLLRGLGGLDGRARGVDDVRVVLAVHVRNVERAANRNAAHDEVVIGSDALHRHARLVVRLGRRRHEEVDLAIARERAQDALQQVRGQVGQAHAHDGSQIASTNVPPASGSRRPARSRANCTKAR